MSFSENDIRPKELDAGKLHALQQDLNWLKKYLNKFIEVGCPACEHTDFTQNFEKYGFKFVRCSNCNTVFMNPRAPQDLLDEFYKQSALYTYWDKYIFPASRQARREKIFRPRVQKIIDLCKKHHIATNLLVDVGASTGMFCQEALQTKQFARIIGIEPGASQAATCRKYGIEIIECPVEKAVLPDYANVITSFETIEHLFSPQFFVRKCNELLAPGGLLVLTCPNIEGFDILTLQTMSDSLDAEHINLFTPESLACMIKKQGFEILANETPGELDAELVRSKVLTGEYNLDAQPFLKKILVTEWDKFGKSFQNYLKNQKLSSHLWLVARKM